MRKPGSESRVGFFLVQGFKIFFPLVYISELSNKRLTGMNLNIVVMNGTERPKTCQQFFSAYELLLSSLPGLLLW